MEFRRLPIVGRSVTEFDDNKLPVRSWVDYYQTVYPFNGYKSIPADAVMIASPRYFHTELHNILPENMRPPADGSFNNEFVSNMADSRGLDLARAKKPQNVWNKVIILLGIALVMEFILWGIFFYVTH